MTGWYNSSWRARFLEYRKEGDGWSHPLLLCDKTHRRRTMMSGDDRQNSPSISRQNRPSATIAFPLNDFFHYNTPLLRRFFLFDFSLLQLTKVSAKARAKTNAINSFMLKPPSVVQKILTSSQYDCTMQSTNFSITVSIQMCNFSMNAVLFRRFAGCSPAFLAVWGGQ